MDLQLKKTKEPVVAKRITLRDQIAERPSDLFWLIYVGILYIWASSESVSQWIGQFVPGWCLLVAWIPVVFIFLLSVKTEFSKWKQGEEFDGFTFARAGFIGIFCLIGASLGLMAMFRG